MDIAFIIDSSGSIGRRNWVQVKRFVKSLVSKLDVSNSATRVAAIAFSTDPEVVMRFNDDQGTDEVNRGFDGMRHQRGYTFTDKALELADNDLFQTSNGMRLSAPKVRSSNNRIFPTTARHHTKIKKPRLRLTLLLTDTFFHSFHLAYFVQFL